MHKVWQTFSMWKPFACLIASFLLLALTAGCQQEAAPETIRLSGQTMGTTWSVILLPEVVGTDSAHLKRLLQNRLDQINGLMSTYDPESELSLFNNQTSSGWFTISADTARVIQLSQQISTLSDGAFDVSVGPLVELWGFSAAKRRERIPTAEQINATLTQVGYKNIELRQNPVAVRKHLPELQIDLSAVAKGYAVDVLAEILTQQGIKNYLLEIGGELQVSGHRGDRSSWQIAIEKPLEGVREVAAIFPLTNTALATSGNYRNFYIEDGHRYSHTIDPVSGKPIRHKLASATVLDPSCARADALATTLMVLGEEKGRQFCERNQIAAYFLIHEQKTTTTYASPAFQLLLKETQQ